MKKLKLFCLSVLLILFLLFIYFVKCQLDIALIKDFPLDKYPPLSLLQNRNPHHIVHFPEAQVNLLLNRLPFLSGVGIWQYLWMQEKGMVILGHDPKGHNNSSSLVITSRSAKNWTLVQKKSFEVSSGDVYSFSGWVKTSGKEVGALSVALYDGRMRVKQWDYAIKTVSSGDWQKVEQKFTVPFGVRYIQFYLSGKGEGKVWFDEIKFMKE